MLKITKRPLAKDDLKDIWRYTYREWGEKQADKYIIELGKGINQLIDNPEIGTTCSYEIKYHQYAINHHIIFYRINSTEIIIVRVLHERMDPKKHL
jgi:toxin ParE1/3/4